MACLLCLEHGMTPARFIDIFSEEGCQMNICSIIAKHLWLKPERDISTGQRICWTCWEALRDFHIFYQRVAEVHNRADWKTPFAHIEQEQENDPLPQEIQLKSEDATNSEEKLQTSADMEGNLFDSEVKLEVYDLDLLPQIEIIEESTPASKRAQRAKRRGRPPKDPNAKTSAIPKRIKRDPSPLAANDDDSETELPLSVLLNASIKTDTNDDSKRVIEISPAEDESKTENETATTSTTEPQKKRRGRPRKVRVEEASPNINVTKQKEKNENKDNGKKDIKTEQVSLNSDAEDNDNDREFIADFGGCSGTDDSGDSSSDNTDSDESLPDFEPKPQYAVIPKKKVVKPKKYRKREKPLVPPKRMTKEELEAKRAQQDEYDKAIRQFFGRFACPKCELLVQNFAEIRGHFRASHNEDPGYMMCCGRKFPQRKALAEHIYLHWNPEHFKCTQCGRLFQDSRNLEQHEEAHVNPPEPKERKMFQCDKCPKVFTTKAAFEHHSFSKHVPKSEFKFSCTLCNKKLPTQRKLKDHMKYNHDPESTIICDKCGKQVRTQYLKKHHQLEHSEQPRPIPQPMQCQICGTWLRHMSGLKQHMKSIHEDPGGEHRCSICNKVSTTARALRRHVYLNHECERKFKCTMCEKAFKRPQDLREHTSTHTGEVLYTCPNCPMTFFSNANMYKHRQRLHRAEWEADRKKPRHIANIMAQAMGATAAQRAKQAVGATSAFFAQKMNTSGSTVGTERINIDPEVMQHHLQMAIQ
ncbi:transcription factor grauzone-like [Rhagoletis pomonella]|uniref:LOW QUALITY PROTEIN: transcription factor grauzone-like n=1 Tax=Rhagoletis pomonella TaxID=28610 RepID=UPI00178602AD|nr:LOW QUALITY PROTEIN: transcription factor grauzone-like [Rhagoletis pomonella]XP_036343626.1 transcription factor grauzone-like [Rhagoletis pomonella]XP_036343965.1 transcription factor grauzone-like [Rhagoletis pomonella]